MPLVILNEIHKSFEDKTVFEGASLQLHSREKVGLIGPNGCGKTTLLKLILGTIAPDTGSISRRKGLRISYLPQEPSFDDTKTVIEEMRVNFEPMLNRQKKMFELTGRFGELTGKELQAAMKEYERLNHEFESAGGYRYENKIYMMLTGVGLDQDVYDVKTSALSGGQRSRLALAKTLLSESKLLLLDEPTNHLDLQGIIWLEKFLRNYNGAAVIISHDRYLLDSLVSKILEVENKKVDVWRGTYSKYISAKERIVLHESRAYQQRAEMVKKTIDFIARNKDQEGMRKVARGRKKRLEKLLREQPDFLEKPRGQKRLRFSFGMSDGHSDIAVRCDNLTKQFGSMILLQDLNFEVSPGQRLGITGPNGTGKSTLLKMALGLIEPTAGKVQVNHNLSIGYLDQHEAELVGGRSVLEEAWSAAPDLTEEKLRSRLGGFLFTGESVFKQVSALSGGEQARLTLCKLVLREPDILLLDEPTNHLDIASKEALEEALSGYNGTVLAVSHDRFFLDRIVQRLLVIGADELGRKSLGRFEFVDGGYSEYARLLEERAAEKKVEIPDKEAGKRKPSKPSRSRVRKITPAELRSYNSWSIEKIEQVIILLEEEIEEIQECFGDAKIYKTPSVLAQLKSRFEAKKQELNLLYRAYEFRSE